MTKLRIVHLTDWHDCEVCGSSAAEGYKVFINDSKEPVIERIPSAYCYDSEEFDSKQLLIDILNQFGHEVEIEEDYEQING